MEEIDQDAAWLDAGFGLDPHVLPQFDFLVADGKLSREEADVVIEQRRAAGLPMTPAELQPRPVPLVKELAWTAEFGGPEIRSYDRNGIINYRAMEWSWTAMSSGYCSFSSHFRGANGEHTGWLSLEKAYKKGVRWSHTKILSSQPRVDHGPDELVTITARGDAMSFDEAIDTALDWDFDAVTLSNGDTLYRTGQKSWASVGVSKIEIKEQSEFNVEKPWYWTCHSSEIKPLVDLIRSMDLSGTEATRDLAIERAVGAVDRVIAVCRFLVAKHDMDKLLGAPQVAKEARP